MKNSSHYLDYIRFHQQSIVEMLQSVQFPVSNVLTSGSQGFGNAVIAVYDNVDPNANDAKVLWSWHIWCTEQPEEQKYVIPTNDRTYSGKQYYVLDRNLGATSVQTNSIKSVGLHYQWPTTNTSRRNFSHTFFKSIQCLFIIYLFINNPFL